jgi:hypothetical protein
MRRAAEGAIPERIRDELAKKLDWSSDDPGEVVAFVQARHFQQEKHQRHMRYGLVLAVGAGLITLLVQFGYASQGIWGWAFTAVFWPFILAGAIWFTVALKRSRDIHPAKVGEDYHESRATPPG